MRLLPVRRRLGLLVTPATILRCHRQLIARRWKRHRADPVDPPSPLACAPWSYGWPTENPTWGDRHIHGETVGLGYRIGAPTVWTILHNAPASTPSPRRAGPTWRQFLQAQAHAILACDLSRTTNDSVPPPSVHRPAGVRDSWSPCELQESTAHHHH